jgi:hypothetical protein
MAGVEIGEFIAARLVQDEHAALEANGWDTGSREEGQPVAWVVYLRNMPPARALREIEAKRAILAGHLPIESIYGLACKRCVSWQDSPGDLSEFGLAIPDPWPCLPVRAIAAVHSDHPDYDPAWAPELASA